MIAAREVAGHAAKRRITAREGACHIAIRASESGGPGGTIQIKAQILRERQSSADRGSPLGFTLPVDATSGETAEPRWSEADVERAIAAAEQAGLGAYRIEIAPDGTIAIVVGLPDAPGSG